MILISFFLFLSNVVFLFTFDLHHLLTINRGFGEGPSGRGGGFNNPTQPPRGDPSAVRGLKDDKTKEDLSELKKNLDKEKKEKEECKENIDINKDKESKKRKRDSISSSSSEERRKYGSQERLLLKDKKNKKRKCNIF